ncbi:MAG: hypothetical protein LBG04_02415 [Holosporaceae bacterium]|nr:hypothetical protein [Holosporaceae bacterium]
MFLFKPTTPIRGEVCKRVAIKELTTEITVDMGTDAVINVDDKIELSEDDENNRRGGDI